MMVPVVRAQWRKRYPDDMGLVGLASAIAAVGLGEVMYPDDFRGFVLVLRLLIRRLRLVLLHSVFMERLGKARGDSEFDSR